MPEIKYAEINETKDLKELFEFICAKVLEKTTLEVKRDLLKWTGKDKELLVKQVTFNDLFTLFDKIDMPFKLKVRYVVPEIKKVILPEPTPPHPVTKELEEQAKDIKTPAFTLEPDKKEDAGTIAPDAPKKDADDADDLFKE